ncbi:MAG: hypothetical protein ACKVPX_12095 [Myxococcaceae bacterium]
MSNPKGKPLSAAGMWLNAVVSRRGLSLRKLARTAGVSHAALSIASSSGPLSVKLAEKIRRTLSLTDDDMAQLHAVQEDPGRAPFTVALAGTDSVLDRKRRNDVRDVFLAGFTAPEETVTHWRECVVENLRRDCSYTYFLPDGFSAERVALKLEQDLGEEFHSRRLQFVSVPPGLHDLWFQPSRLVLRLDSGILGVWLLQGLDGRSLVRATAMSPTVAAAQLGAMERVLTRLSSARPTYSDDPLTFTVRGTTTPRTPTRSVDAPPR